MFSNTLFLKIAVRNDNQNMCANLISPEKEAKCHFKPENGIIR